MTETQSENDGQVSASLFGMMMSLSTALDLINPALDNHHKLTCYITCCLAQELDLPEDDYNDLFMATILHDIGAIALSDRMKLLEFEEYSPHLHAELGSILLSKFLPFARFAPLVRFHHVDWEEGEGRVFKGGDVPYLSQLIHLADRVAGVVNKNKPVFSQVAEIREKIAENSGRRFVPEHVDAFLKISRKEVFWLDMYFAHLDEKLLELSRLPNITLGTGELTELSRFFAIIIDTRSRFTATHTSGVAACSHELAQLCGMSSSDCQRMLIAGYLHDLGKLAVPSEILEKNGKLDIDEWRIMQAHTYHTRNILESIEGIEDIAIWASYHHESLSGDGYPFHVSGDDIPLGSRIVMVADIFTALTEDRPYRKGMARDEIENVFKKLVAENKIDETVVGMLMSNYELVDKICKEAQGKSGEDAREFWEYAKSTINKLDKIGTSKSAGSTQL